MKRKMLCLVLAMLLVVSLLPATAFAATYKDTEGHWAEGPIERWSGYGVVKGRARNVFDADSAMSRAEAAQVFANLLGLNKKGDLSKFSDVEQSWYTEALAKCVAAGIMNGRPDGTIDPNGLITREEFLTMYARAICIGENKTPADAKLNMHKKGFTDADKVADWAAEAINTLIERGYVNGMTDTTLEPRLNINRGSVMSLLDKSISTYIGKESTETKVEAKSEGITLIASTAVTTVTGTADVVVVAAGAEQYNEETGEIEHNDIRVESAKMPVARVQGENITVTLAVNTTAEDASITETGVDSEIVMESTSSVKSATVEAEGAKVVVKDGAKAESITVAETASNATVEASRKAEISQITVAAEDSIAKIAGTVETVTIEESAKNAVVDTASTAKVANVENSGSGTSVKGSGKVETVASTEDVVVETKNTKVENTNEEKQIAVTDSKGKETEVPSKTEAEASGSAASGTTVNKQETQSGGGYVPPAHTHSYSYYAISDTQHEGICACGEKAAAANHDTSGTEGACSVCGYKDGNVARIGSVFYDSLSAAVNAAQTADTVVLLTDVALEVKQDINNKTLTIDLNGKTISRTVADSGAGNQDYCKNSSDPVFWIYGGADVTFTDSVGGGKVIGKSANGERGAAFNVNNNNNGTDADPVSIVTLKGGTFEGGYAGSYVFFNGKVVLDGAIIKDGYIGIAASSTGADIEIKGGEINGAEWYGISANGTQGVNRDPYTIKMFGGKIENVACGIYHPNGGNVTVSGGIITATDAAIEVRGGILNISGGVFTATADKFESKSNGSGTTAIGAAVAVAQHTTKLPINVTISGGTFNGVKALTNDNPENNDTTAQEKVSVIATGGTYSSDPTAYVATFGYKVNGVMPSNGQWGTINAVEGKWTVTANPSEGAEVSVSKTGTPTAYGTLAEFRDAVNGGNDFAGYTVTLLKDVDLAGIANWTPIGTFEHPFSGTFDGNNKTISNLTVNADNGAEGLFGYVFGDTYTLDLSSRWNGEDYTFDISNLSDDFTAVVKDFTLERARISTATKKATGVIGSAEKAYISGINIFNTNISGCKSVGGIVGNINGSLVENCTTSADSVITANTYNVGGIVGVCNNPPKTKFEKLAFAILNCTNNADIVKEGAGGYFGGILGSANVAAGTYNAIVNCTNNGSISDNTDGVKTTTGVAGIVGDLYSNGHEQYLINCTNTGDITIHGTCSYAAGIAQNARVFGVNLVNSGNISANASGHIAGILACPQSGPIFCSCYNTGTLSGVSEEKQFDICSENNSTIVLKSEFGEYANVAALNQAITGLNTQPNDIMEFVLAGVTVADTTDMALIIPKNALSFTVKGEKVCDTVEFEAGRLCTTSVNIDNVTVNIETECSRTLSFFGTDETINVNSECATIEVNGNGSNAIVNADLSGSLNFGGTGTITATISEGKTVHCVRFLGIGNYTVNNYGTITNAGSGGHVIYTQSPCTFTVNNHGTIENTTTGATYALLFYGGCDATFNAYSDSTLSTTYQGLIMACGSAGSVKINYQAGATLTDNGQPRTYPSLKWGIVEVTEMNE